MQQWEKTENSQHELLVEVENRDNYAEQNTKAPFLSISASQLHNPTKAPYKACFTPRLQPPTVRPKSQIKDNSTNGNKEVETPSHTLFLADQDSALNITISSTPEPTEEKTEIVNKISSKSCKNLNTQQRPTKTESRKKSAEKKKKKSNKKTTTTQLDWGLQETPLCEYAVVEKPPQTPHIVDAFPVPDDPDVKPKFVNQFVTGKPPVSPSKRGQRSASAQKRKPPRNKLPKKTPRSPSGKKEPKNSNDKTDPKKLNEKDDVVESNDSVMVTSLDIRDSIEVIPSAEIADSALVTHDDVTFDDDDGELDVYFTPSEKAPTCGEKDDDVTSWEKLILASFGSDNDDDHVEISSSDDNSTDDDDWFNLDHEDLLPEDSSNVDETPTEAGELVCQEEVSLQVEKETDNISIIAEQPITITPVSELSVASFKNLRKGPLIGMGGFGKVWQGMTDEGHLIAIKQVELTLMDRKQALQEYSRLQREVNILRDMRHPNIVSFIGTDLVKNVVKIYMEYLSGGSITSILKSYGALVEPVFKRYTKQILEGVSYIHSENVVHRDINGNNIMLLPSGIIKLIDFGCAKRLQRLAVSSRHGSTTNSIDHTTVTSHKSSFGTIAGTPNWMAPEVITESRFGPKSDIWSVGCTVYEMATGKPPLHELEPISAIFHIGSNKPMPNIPDECSPNAHQLVEACLNHDRSKRPSAQQLLELPFFHEPSKFESSEC